MTFVIGLTGSIGMGKSSTAEIFRRQGCAVWDADAAVHRLYAKGGLAVEPMGAAFPNSISDGEIDRTELKNIIGQDPLALKKIEAIVHPLVATDRAEFLSRHKGEIIVLDIPLLFETGAAANMNAVVVVSIDANIQRRRVLERGTMTDVQLDTILAKQMSDAEKRAGADYVVITDSPEHAEDQVKTILKDIRARTNA